MRESDNFDTAQSIFEDIEKRLAAVREELANLKFDSKSYFDGWMNEDGTVGLESLEVESALDAISDASNKLEEASSALSDFEDNAVNEDDE